MNRRQSGERPARPIRPRRARRSLCAHVRHSKRQPGGAVRYPGRVRNALRDGSLLISTAQTLWMALAGLVLGGGIGLVLERSARPLSPGGAAARLHDRGPSAHSVNCAVADRAARIRFRLQNGDRRRRLCVLLAGRDHRSGGGCRHRADTHRGEPRPRPRICRTRYQDRSSGGASTLLRGSSVSPPALPSSSPSRPRSWPIRSGLVMT